jgi:hypothetical protein
MNNAGFVFGCAGIGLLFVAFGIVKILFNKMAILQNRVNNLSAQLNAMYAAHGTSISPHTWPDASPYSPSLSQSPSISASVSPSAPYEGEEDAISALLSAPVLAAPTAVPGIESPAVGDRFFFTAPKKVRRFRLFRFGEMNE